MYGRILQLILQDFEAYRRWLKLLSFFDDDKSQVVQNSQYLLAKAGSIYKIFPNAPYYTSLCPNLNRKELIDFFFTLNRLVHHVLNYKIPTKIYLHNEKKVVHYLQHKIGIANKENFVCFFLGEKNQLLQYEELYVGVETKILISPKEIATKCIRHGASKVIVAHNHPSGSEIPSENDIIITKKIKKTLEFLDLELLFWLDFVFELAHAKKIPFFFARATTKIGI